MRIQWQDPPKQCLAIVFLDTNLGAEDLWPPLTDIRMAVISALDSIRYDDDTVVLYKLKNSKAFQKTSTLTFKFGRRLRADERAFFESLCNEKLRLPYRSGVRTSWLGLRSL